MTARTRLAIPHSTMKLTLTTLGGHSTASFNHLVSQI
jgi:hypothetical protein